MVYTVTIGVIFGFPHFLYSGQQGMLAYIGTLDYIPKLCYFPFSSVCAYVSSGTGPATFTLPWGIKRLNLHFVSQIILGIHSSALLDCQLPFLHSSTPQVVNFRS